VSSVTSGWCSSSFFLVLGPQTSSVYAFKRACSVERLTDVTSVSKEGYQTNGLRIQCRSGDVM
jgi:hypothetical protein